MMDVGARLPTRRTKVALNARAAMFCSDPSCLKKRKRRSDR